MSGGQSTTNKNYKGWEEKAGRREESLSKRKYKKKNQTNKTKNKQTTNKTKQKTIKTNKQKTLCIYPKLQLQQIN